MKVCNNPKCVNPNPIFSKNKNSKDGLSNRCKQCVKESVKKSYLKNREYYIKEETKRHKQWKENNPEKYKEQRIKFNELYKNKDYWTKYYQDNKEKFNTYAKQPEVIEKRKKRWKEKYGNNIEFKLKEIMKANFHSFFKDKGKNKNLSFLKVISYTYSELKSHLENNFREGMNWENMGELWEIHHIKPQSMFNPLIEKEVKECWDLKNLIPLWKTTEISIQMGDNIVGNRNVPKNKVYNPKFGNNK